MAYKISFEKFVFVVYFLTHKTYYDIRVLNFGGELEYDFGGELVKLVYDLFKKY